MKKLLKEPLLHFLLIGGLLFLVFELIPSQSENQVDEIVITQGDIRAVKANFARTRQRPPTEKELSGIIEEMVREEIAYREALALGLDKDDSVIRRRMRMKMELLIEDIAGLAPPTDEDLKAYLEEYRDTFRQQPQISFMQVFLSPDKRGMEVEKDAQGMLGELRAVGKKADPDSYGDRSMLPKELPLYRLNNIGRVFGVDFTGQLLEIPLGEWTGPVWSSYGLHLVYVRERIEGRDPELDEVRRQVEREWTVKRRLEIKQQTYAKLREQYKVTIEQIPAEPPEQTARTQ